VSEANQTPGDSRRVSGMAVRFGARPAPPATENDIDIGLASVSEPPMEVLAPDPPGRRRTTYVLLLNVNVNGK